jgi:eukaryotic-like serine/threonine-protein kinase
MNSEQWHRVDDLLQLALQLPPGERDQFLQQACACDDALEEEVRSLLSAQREAGGFLDSPAVAIAVEALEFEPDSVESQAPGLSVEGAARPLPSHLGRYRILRLVGEGGMGAVYEAEQENPRRPVALKVIRCGVPTAELQRRFERESQILGRLHHPGIAQIYEAGTAETDLGPLPYFAMEFVRGQLLAEYVEAQHLNLRQKLELMLKIFDAVHHAHQQGVIHRDLKPANVLVDNMCQPKILDFGLSRLTGSDLTITHQTDLGQLVGTLAYMSPEQVLADPMELDTRSDVYALGVVLYELLSGRLPYPVSEKIHEAIQTIRQTDPAPLSSINRSYRGDIETIAAKTLEKDKARRYGSAAELAEDIRRYLRDEPIVARPASTAYQLQKFAQRNKGLVAAVAVVFTVLAAGVVTSTWEAMRARRERDRAASAERLASSQRDRALLAEQTAKAAQAQAVEERNRALAEKQRADTEAATAKSVNDFLRNDLLAQAGPMAQSGSGGKPNPDITVRNALDRAAARIAGKFDSQPLVEASIRQTISEAYWDLGMYSESVQQSEHAIELRRHILGEENRDTLESMAQLAGTLTKQGKYAEAQPIAARVLDIRRRIFGQNDADTLASMETLGNIYMLSGKYAEAASLLSQSAEGRRRTSGENDRMRLSALNNLAVVYYRQGDQARTLAILSELVDAERRALGEEDPSTLAVINNLAILYRNLGNYVRAEEMMTKVLDVRRRVLGDAHADTLLSLNTLATLYASEEKYALSEPLFLKALEGRIRVRGEENDETLGSMIGLADLYENTGRYSEAEVLYGKVLDISRRVLGTDHPVTATTLASMGKLRLRQQRYSDAAALLQEALAVQEKKAPNGWVRYNTESLLGSALVAQGKYDEAEPLLVSALQGLFEQKANIPHGSRTALNEAGERIVQLYEQWGKPEKAAAWRGKLNSRPK